jgi:hypothetical protein
MQLLNGLRFCFASGPFQTNAQHFRKQRVKMNKRSDLVQLAPWKKKQNKTKLLK